VFAWTATQIRVLDASARTFAAKGFDASTTDDIAAVLGQSKGVVYYNFRSKLDLFIGIYRRGMDELGTAVEAAMAGAGGGEERLLAATTAHVRRIMAMPDYHHVIQQGIDARTEGRMTAEDRKRLAELVRLRDAHEARFVDIVKAGVRDRSLDAESPVLAARTILGAILGVGNWYRPRATQSDEELDALAAVIAGIIVRGIVAR
jgi:AcrR family transcriptional regulator